MSKVGSPTRSALAAVLLIGIAVVPTYTAGAMAPQPPALVATPITGFGPARQIVGADLNGDGNTDLIGAFEGGTATSVRVAISNGNGGWTSMASYFSGVEPAWVAAGDMNGDGYLDVVAANRNNFNPGGSIAILLGDGTGALAAPIAIAHDRPRALAVADFNGDGRQDVAVVNAANTLSIRLNDGAGGLTMASTSAVAASAFNIAAADFDRDGKMDVAVVSYGPVFGTATALTTFRGNGDGTLSGKTEFKASAEGGAAYFVFGNQFYGMAVSDLNGDGASDIVLSSQGHQTHFRSNSANWVMLNNGTGGFPSATRYAGTDMYSGLALGDLNDDGNLDLATASTQGWFVDRKFGDGTGAFSGAVQDNIGGSAPEWVVLGNFNGSGPGTLDIVANRVGLDPVIFLNGEAPCAAGTFGSGGANCAPAPMGSYVPNAGAATATLCPIGTYSDTVGATACTPAPAGSFVDTPGATFYTWCGAGSYSDAVGSSACTLAPAGTFVPGPGQTSATPCAAGLSSDEGASFCADRTAPVITGTPGDFSVEATGATATVTYTSPSASDSFDGALGVSCSPASGSSLAVGSHLVTCTAADAAGNSTSTSFTVTVNPPSVVIARSGFYQPVKSGVNDQKGGSTVPLKFNVTLNGVQKTDTAGLEFSLTRVSCSTGAPIAAAPFTMTGGTAFRYSDGQFIANWKTPTDAGSCYVVKMTTTADGGSISAVFKIK